MISFFQASDFVDSLYEIIAIEVGVGFKYNSGLNYRYYYYNEYLCSYDGQMEKRPPNSLSNC